MQAKLSKIKGKQQKNDVEVKSDSDDGIDGQKQNKATSRKNQILNDPFFQFEDDGAVDDLGKEVETAEEKRLRLANQILDEYAKEDKNDFFESLQAKTIAEENIM